MIAQASQANQLTQQLVQIIQAQPLSDEPLILNEILQAVMQSALRESQGKGPQLTARFANGSPCHHRIA